MTLIRRTEKNFTDPRQKLHFRCDFQILAEGKRFFELIDGKVGREIGQHQWIFFEQAEDGQFFPFV